MNQLLILGLAGMIAAAAPLEWPQFGGPSRDFNVNVTTPFGAAPKKLWSRDLGDGYSSISVDGAVLYTMYRRGTQEVVIAADANTSKTI